MDCGEEGSGVFGVAGRDAAPAFQVEESVLDEMSQLVQILVIWPLYRAVFLRRDDHVHALPLRLFKDRVGVVTLVGQKMFCGKPLNQSRSLRAISRGALRDKHSDRHTMRIHGQMYLGVEPPFVRLMSWFPPHAPAAWGWTLQ